MSRTTLTCSPQNRCSKVKKEGMREENQGLRKVRDRFGDWRFTSVVKCSICRWYRDYKKCEVFGEPPEKYWLGKEECSEYEPASS